jgi:predicted PolB exonuclease-like 3'-5' exonuclease
MFLLGSRRLVNLNRLGCPACDSDEPMAHEHLLCLDIETVPDRDLIPADWPEAEFVRKPIWHKVVAISFVEARIEYPQTGGERYLVECCRTGGEASYDERQLLQAYWRHFTRRRARVVTWNGKGFDLPVLRLRAMMHGIPAETWFTRGTKWESYTQRYAPDWHCDLMERLADYGASAKLTMEDIALAMDLPGKVGGHGSEVAAMVAQGRIEQVRAYCEADCLNLFALYVRWAFLTGRVDAAGHNASLKSVITCLEAGARHGRTWVSFWTAGAARPGQHP